LEGQAGFHETLWFGQLADMMLGNTEFQAAWFYQDFGVFRVASYPIFLMLIVVAQ
jgi:hypothetical protein